MAAPGGDYCDSPDNTGDPRNLVLAAFPERLGRLSGEIDNRGNPTTPLIVSQFGHRDARHGGLTMPVDQVQRVLYQSAVERACPQPRLFHYKRIL